MSAHEKGQMPTKIEMPIATAADYKKIETRSGKTVYMISGDKALVCSFCGKKAVLPLTPDQLKAQPDDTTHVCHPSLDGCNQGFAVD